MNLESSSIFHQVIVDAKLQQSSSKNLRCRRCHGPHHPLSSNFHSVNRSFARRLRSPSLMNRMGMSGEDSCSNSCLQHNHVATTNVSSKHHTMHIYYFIIYIYTYVSLYANINNIYMYILLQEKRWGPGVFNSRVESVSGPKKASTPTISDPKPQQPRSSIQSPWSVGSNQSVKVENQ